MQKLYNKLSKYTLKDAIILEESDRQFIALKKLEQHISDKNLYLALIISNSIICYQLSGKGEDYWEEFSEYFSNCLPLVKGKYPKGDGVNKFNLIDELKKFISNSKNNKRFVDTKHKRLEKIRSFIENDFLNKSAYYYENMIELRDVLSKTMKQKNDAKTIVFAIKMFSYGARNIYSFVKFPDEIFIPIDSRLEALYEKYKEEYTDIKLFYSDLAEKLNIPILHLDGIVWTLYDELIKEDV